MSGAMPQDFVRVRFMAVLLSLALALFVLIKKYEIHKPSRLIRVT